MGKEEGEGKRKKEQSRWLKEKVRQKDRKELVAKRKRGYKKWS